MQSKELILEILSEDIPASMQALASKKATLLFNQLFEGAIYKTLEVFISKERLTLLISGLEESLKKKVIRKRGPKECGVALEHFIKSVNVTSKDDLIFENGYYYFTKEVVGESINDFIPKMLFEFLRKMQWPKTMKWHNLEDNTQTIPWVRPIRSIACVYNKEPIYFKVEGLPVSTTSSTRGNRFLSNEIIKITNIDSYKDDLKRNFIIIDQKERKEAIEAALNDVKADIDQELLEETVGLVDYPFIIESKIDKEFLTLPHVVLKTVMKVHQKYFCKGDDGFVIVTDMQNSEKILKGHERVLRSRLKDAKFFYDMDAKTTLQSLVKDLDKIVYHEKLGSMLDKVNRIESLMTSPKMKLAAHISKADILTNMVREFPELQGIIGSYYCNDSDVSEIIKDHLSLDPNKGSELAIRDRMDTLVGFFGIDIKPTGSKDPYALRRAAIVVLRILIKDKQASKLGDIINDSIKTYGDKLTNKSVFEDVFEFVSEKLPSLLGFLEVINTSFLKEETVYNASNRLKVAVSAFKDFSDIYKRIIGFKTYFNEEVPEKKDPCVFDFEKFDIKYDDFEQCLDDLKKLNKVTKQFLDTTTILSDDMLDRKRHLYTIFKMYQAFFVFFRGII